jgi:hypothetical protein
LNECLNNVTYFLLLYAFPQVFRTNFAENLGRRRE